MSNNENGGPAFPNTYAARTDQGRGPVVEMHDSGMALRDYFAAKAMQGICAHVDNWGLLSYGIAEKAYSLADAMLRERAK